MSEMLLNSLDYTIDNRYNDLGLYCGIFNDSYLLFVYNVDWLRADTALFNHEIKSIPTLNEVLFINYQIQYGKITHLSKYTKLTDQNKHIVRRIITIDELYYNPTGKNCLLTLRRVY